MHLSTNLVPIASHVILNLLNVHAIMYIRICCMHFTDIIKFIISKDMFIVLMCKSPRAVQVTGKMYHIQSVWKGLL